MTPRISSKFAGLIIFGSLSYLAPVQAAVIYVTKTNPAPVRALRIVRIALSNARSTSCVQAM